MNVAIQFRMKYPRKPQARLEDGQAINVLFVCSMNRWRSPTAEKVYEKHDLIHVRSRGTSRKAVRTVGADDLKWADVIIAMETKHRTLLKSRFSGEISSTECHVLHIPDDYQFMDPELVQIIKDATGPILGEWDG